MFILNMNLLIIPAYLIYKLIHDYGFYTITKNIFSFLNSSGFDSLTLKPVYVTLDIPKRKNILLQEKYFFHKRASGIP